MISRPPPNLILIPFLTLSLSCGGRPTSWGDSGSSTAGGGDGGGGSSSSSLSGVWSKYHEQDGIEQEVFLTFESGGICEILLDIPDFGPYPIACTYSADGSSLTIQDTECENESYGEGSYGYTISGSTLTLTEVDESCPTREALPGDWTRSSD